MTAPMPPLPGVTGIVLAGGRSSRFGSDKLAADLEGRAVLDHALAAMAEVATRIVVVVAPGAAPALPTGLEGRIRVVEDPEAFGGPLVGLAAALDEVPSPGAVVAGGDMPRLVPAVLRLLAVAVGPGLPAVTLEVPGGLQPLPMAVDVAAARTAARTVLARGGRSLREFLREVGAATIRTADWTALDPARATITDVDRPSDLDA